MAAAAAAAAETAEDALLQDFTNRIASAINDTRDTLRTIHAQNCESHAYMDTAEPDLEDLDFERTTVARTFQDMHTLCKPPIVFDETTLSNAIAAAESAHGTAELRARILNLVDAYTNTYTKLCFAHMQCMHTMGKFRALTEGLHDVPYVGMAEPEFAAFQTAMIDYIKHAHSNVLGVQKAYEAFQSCYVEWLSLRNALLALHPFARGGIPSCSAVCTICTTDPVQYVYVPCGHTFCRNCTQKQTGMCFVCRTPVEKTQQLFFL
jgi:hypothetical protein